MSPIFIGAFIVGMAIVLILVNRASNRQEAERAEEYRKYASLRGWRLEYDPFTSPAPEFRYSGTTDGVPWTYRTVRHRKRHEAVRNPARWETTIVKLDQGALLVWPNFGEPTRIGVEGVPQFVLDMLMRPVATALGATAADVPLLAHATEVVDGPEGYLFRATDAAAMRSFLAHGAFEALADARSWLADPQSPHHLLVLVFWHRGLQIATPYA